MSFPNFPLTVGRYTIYSGRIIKIKSVLNLLDGNWMVRFYSNGKLKTVNAREIVLIDESKEK